MGKYIAIAEQVVRFLELLAAITILFYGIIWFERWQRPEEVRNPSYSVDTNKMRV